MLIYTLISYIKLYKKVSASICLSDNIYLCDEIKSPFILGIFKPKIYLPSDITESQMQSVIAHEKAHVKRLDHIWKPLGFAVLTVHWFNPFVWLAYILLCRDIEFACDEKVIKTMSADGKKDYSQTLLSLSISKHTITACPLAFGEVGVKDRIKSVLNYKKPALWIIIIALIAIAGMASGFMTSPLSNNISGKIFAPSKYYAQEVIGVDRANKEQMSERYYISEDLLMTKYIDDGINYSVNIQCQLKETTDYDKALISMILDELPEYYSNMTVKKVYLGTSNFDLTEYKDIWMFVKFSNGTLIYAYIPCSGDDAYYVHEVCKLKTVNSNAAADDLPDEIGISGSNGTTECEGVNVSLIEADYSSDAPYITILLKNATGKELTYDVDFDIFRYENGTKIDMWKSANKVTAEKLYATMNNLFTRKFSLDGYDLSKPGTYSLEFKFSIADDVTKYTANIEFEIADTPENYSAEQGTSAIPEESTSKTTPDEYTTTIAMAFFFDATVLEVNENNILVEPFEDEAEYNSSNRIYVSTKGLSDMPQLKIGDTVQICYNGQLKETYPAQITAYSINLLE